MAVAKVRKVRTLIHRSEVEQLLISLQDRAILHIEFEEQTLPPGELDQIRIRLEQVISELEEGEKKSFLASVLPEKVPIRYEDLRGIVASVNLDQVLNEYLMVRKKRDELENRKKTIEEDIAVLSPWGSVVFDPTYWRKTSYLLVIPVQFPNPQALETALANLGDREIGISVVNRDVKIQCFAVGLKSKEDEIRFWLSEWGGEVVELPVEGSARDRLIELKRELNGVEVELGRVEEKIQTFKSLIDKLRISYDAIAIDRDRIQVQESIPKTSYISIITGWIKEKDVPVFEEIVNQTATGIIEYLPFDDKDRPPVALENRSIFKPFELIVNLYSPPNPKEVDPAPLISLFFLFFFGLCITDAMYGIILAILAFIGLKKMRAGRELLWILFGGGLMTIIPGAATGGWFGNLFEMLPFKFLNDFRNRLMLFDPMENPMPFFYFALLVGYIQVMFGIVVEAYDSFRNRDYATGFFNNITWIIFLNSLPLLIILKSYRPIIGLVAIVNACLILVFTRRGGVSIIDQILFFLLFFILSLKVVRGPLTIPIKIPAILLLCPLVGIGIRFRSAKRMMKKIAWGLYGLYNGTVSFISAVISYVRLMALGMVTAGIAMVINTVIGMVSGIPIAGIIIGLLIFIGGTIFNIAINTLGGFIHTMRLQYVEFFQRFYVGGGRRFEPFGYNTKFYELRR